MHYLQDKLIIFFCCLSLYLLELGSFHMVPILVSVFFTCLISYYEDRRLKLGFYLIFISLCYILPPCFIFAPLLIYDIAFYDYQILIGLVFLPLIANYSIYNLQIILLTTVFIVLSILFKYKTNYCVRIQLEYNDLRDSSTELSILQEEKNQSILENQDYEINVATLNERNRISKDIHDNIGHLLSRSLLQIGALLTISKEEAVRESLTLLKESISQGMDSIRDSIHDMHDESIDLYTTIESIVKDFNFCPITFEYDINISPNSKLKYSFIAIIKEALANIIKHSNGNKVTIILREHPAMYQLIISDNGVLSEGKQTKINKLMNSQIYYDGMGLQNILDRVKGFNGQFHISTEAGFKIFITVPKERIFNDL